MPVEKLKKLAEEMGYYYSPYVEFKSGGGYIVEGIFIHIGDEDHSILRGELNFPYIEYRISNKGRELNFRLCFKRGKIGKQNILAMYKLIKKLNPEYVYVDEYEENKYLRSFEFEDEYGLYEYIDKLHNRG